MYSKDSRKAEISIILVTYSTLMFKNHSKTIHRYVIISTMFLKFTFVDVLIQKIKMYLDLSKYLKKNLSRFDFKGKLYTKLN